MAFASIDITQTGGVTYCSDKVVPATEEDLYNGAGGDPFVAKWDEAIVATVRLTIAGVNNGNVTYVILQGDFGDGVFVDLAGVRWTDQTGAATFVVCAGELKANTFQATRVTGTAPAANFSNVCPLPPRLRFVGKAALSPASPGSSSAAPGQSVVVKATIKYRFQSLR